MKKIAFVTHHTHTITGGIETFNKALYNHLSGKYNITEYPIYKTDEKDKLQSSVEGVVIDMSLCEWNGPNYLGGRTYKDSKMSKIFEENDVVIFSLMAFPKKWINNNKSILVQHMNKDYYGFIGKHKIDKIAQFGFLFGSLLFNIGTISNGFKHASNVVFYSKETSLDIKGNSNFIPLGVLPLAEMNASSIEKNSITWMARLHTQKTPLDAVKIANINSKVNIYGAGNLEDKVVKKLKNKDQFKGLVKFEDRMQLLHGSKAFLLTSKVEGFAYTVGEALSVGVPVVMYDSFDAAQFYNNCDSVFLVKKGDWKSANEKLDEIMNMSTEEYGALQEKALTFARENLSLETFLSRWDKVIRENIVND